MVADARLAVFELGPLHVGQRELVEAADRPVLVELADGVEQLILGLALRVRDDVGDVLAVELQHEQGRLVARKMVDPIVERGLSAAAGTDGSGQGEYGEGKSIGAHQGVSNERNVQIPENVSNYRTMYSWAGAAS